MMMTFPKTFRLLACTGLVLSSLGSFPFAKALAADASSSTQPLTREQIIEQLKPKEPDHSDTGTMRFRSFGGGTRGVKVTMPSATQEAEPSPTPMVSPMGTTTPSLDAQPQQPDTTQTVNVATPAIEAAKVAPSINMQITFEFNSDRLTIEAKRALAALGTALVSDELANYQFVIAGHTDARGQDDYNLSLSQRRARTVRNHLINNFGISPDRLAAVGYGETQLLLPESPEAAENRRVQITNRGLAQ